MARKGRAGAALAIAALGSFFAGCVGTIIIAVFAPPLTRIALKFGPAEYFSLMVLGLIGAVVLACGSLLKAIAMVISACCSAWSAPTSTPAPPRFTFGIPELSDGIGFVAVAMGLFGYRRDHRQPRARRTARGRHHQGGRRCGPTREDFRRLVPAVLRGTALGSILGMLPGGGACWRLRGLHGREEDRQGPERFGKGAIEGVAAPEVGQQCRRADLVHPLLTLGIPPNAVMALMVGAMTIQGIQPGPQVMTKQPGAVLGHDRLDVDRQPDAGHHQPAADRHLGEAADGAVPLPVPGDPAVLLHRRLQPAQQHVRRLAGRCSACSATSSSSSAASGAPFLLDLVLAGRL